ncbi:hypothetical protein PR048_029675 [Dryococelus australis]|uniref:Uncharacterized protein n=1 Tax=Dryococelus australis TaxID=614101 RepID=A0ABQ9GE17_9NEOP|nr:hypothetical protein PR048_029675 [Dryococelus australis]
MRKLTRTISVSHEVKLKYNQQIYTRPTALSDFKRRVVEKQVAEMREADVNEPSCSPFYPKVVTVRKVNTYSFSSPPAVNIHETIKDIGVAYIFLTLNLELGYWVIPMHPQSKPLVDLTAHT